MSTIWNPTNVTAILGVAFVPALALVYVCVRECIHRKAGLWSVYTAQAVASVLHLLNELMFMLITAVPADIMPGGCEPVAIATPFFFGTMQPLLAAVLIIRATSIMPPSFDRKVGSLRWWRSRTGARVAIGFVFLCGYLTVVASQILNVRGRNAVTNRCMYIPNRNINIPGKAVIMCSYALIGLVFASALTKHIKTMHHSSHHDSSQGTASSSTATGTGNPSQQVSSVLAQSGTAPTVNSQQPPASDAAGNNRAKTTHQLTKVLRGVTGRILIAVVAYLVTVIVGFANGFVNGSYVQFTIENTSAVLAGTFATQSKKFDEKRRESVAPSSTTSTMAGKQSSAKPTANSKTVNTREMGAE